MLLIRRRWRNCLSVDNGERSFDHSSWTQIMFFADTSSQQLDMLSGVVELFPVVLILSNIFKVDLKYIRVKQISTFFLEHCSFNASVQLAISSAIPRACWLSGQPRRNTISFCTSSHFSGHVIGLAASRLTLFRCAGTQRWEPFGRLTPLRFWHPVLFLALPLA